MADQVFDFVVTVPAGTAIASPQTTKLTMPVRIIEEIEVVVPPGPSGLLGFQLGSAGEPIIPAKGGQWIISDDEKLRWPLERQIESGDWQCFAYNTGSFPHTLHIRFLASLPPLPRSAGFLPLSISSSPA